MPKRPCLSKGRLRLSRAYLAFDFEQLGQLRSIDIGEDGKKPLVANDGGGKASCETILPFQSILIE